MSKQIEKEAEIEREQQQQAMTELKLVEQQPLMNQFSFFGDDNIDLHLGTLPTFHTHTFRLQPTHPNLQDPHPHSTTPIGNLFNLRSLV